MPAPIIATHLINLMNLSDITSAAEARTNLGMSISSIDAYQTNNIDEGATTTNVTYVGLVKDDGTYCIKKLDETTAATPIVTYATVTNNGAVTTLVGFVDISTANIFAAAAATARQLAALGVG